jgi:hypothetical protein
MVDEHEHIWAHLETIKICDSCIGDGLYYKRTDVFFCQKCLKTQNVVQETWNRDRPDWY